MANAQKIALSGKSRAIIASWAASASLSLYAAVESQAILPSHPKNKPFAESRLQLEALVYLKSYFTQIHCDASCLPDLWILGDVMSSYLLEKAACGFEDLWNGHPGGEILPFNSISQNLGDYQNE